ncbi:MAG: beta-phosphoglucomutase [Flavobacteriales bacterium]|nr:beta-phosphoglucomutase [Flavobacteriales bacterium]
MKVSAFLFDLDGVIVDTAKYHFIAWKRLANELGVDFTEEENEQLKGVSRRGSIEKIMEWGNISLPEEKIEHWMKVKNDWYLDLIAHMNPDETLPGARDCLEGARSAGVKIALGSASKNAPMILKQCELEHFFEAVIDGTKVTHSKPHPEVFLKGSEALGVKPELCTVFEDSQAGIEAALAGNMHTVAIGSPDVLPGAEMYVSGLHEFNLNNYLR